MSRSLLSEELRRLARGEIRGAAQAREAAALVLRYAADPEPHDSDRAHPWGFQDAFAVLLVAADASAMDELRREALPALRAIYDRRYASTRSPDLWIALKAFATYGGPEQDTRILDAVRDRLDPDGATWAVVFNTLARMGARAAPLFEAIEPPMPDGWIGLAVLDGANQLAIDGVLRAHPFDCDEGHARLAAWLSEHDPEKMSYGLSATTAIAFIADTTIRAHLLALADRRPEAGIRLEAAWARVRVGEADGLETLGQFATEPRTASAAIRLLEELGAVPSTKTVGQ